MSNKSYHDDQHLDILILGTMKERSEVLSSSAIIKQSVEQILAEPAAQQLLSLSHTSSFKVHIPEGWEDQEIIKGIFSHIDITDLVVINLTPKEGADGPPSPNVYYELGMIHSLGLPAIIISQKGTRLPFYASHLRNIRVNQFTVEEVTEALRNSIHCFLDLNDPTDFISNSITQFYDGLSLVDISAAVGLATGYYYNFVGRVLREGHFVTAYPDKIKHLVIVRPTNVLETYEQDKQRLIDTLSKAGYPLELNDKLDPPFNDGRGLLWFDHYKDILIDLPRTIYPLKISPRLLAMQERLDKPTANTPNHQRDKLLWKTSEQLLDRIEKAIKYHVRKERESYRASHLHYTTISKLPALLQELGEMPPGNN